MIRIVRSALGIFTGLIVAGVLIMAIQLIGFFLYPPPPGFDPNDREAMKALIENAPLGAKLLVLVSYVVGTFVGALLAALIAGGAKVIHGLIIGSLFELAALFNLLSFPHPVWFWVICLSLFLPTAFLGAKCAGREPALKGG